MAPDNRTSLEGQVAVITGASSGIGAGVARELARAGMRLVLTARREERLKAIADELKGRVAYVAADIVEPELPGRLLDRATREFGRCDVVFNNAGIMDVGAIEKIDLDRILLMVRVNVEAAFRLAYEALRLFKRQDRGYLINTSSILGTKVRPTAGWYAATKHAIEALTESLRLELAGTGVRVASLQPGLVDTELQDHWEAHLRPKVALGVKAPLVPEDIARVVRFMLEQPAHVRIPKILVVPGEQGNV
jgi:NADP-dependent 3-hydroxy acid dehydrogenase YdfG